MSPHSLFCIIQVSIRCGSPTWLETATSTPFLLAEISSVKSQTDRVHVAQTQNHPNSDRVSPLPSSDILVFLMYCSVLNSFTQAALRLFFRGNLYTARGACKQRQPVRTCPELRGYSGYFSWKMTSTSLFWVNSGCLAFHVETWRHVSLLATVGLQGLEFFRKYHQILHPKCGS